MCNVCRNILEVKTHSTAPGSFRLMLKDKGSGIARILLCHLRK